MMLFAGNNALLWGGRVVVPAQLTWTVVYGNVLIIVQTCYSLALYERIGIWAWLLTVPQLGLTLAAYLQAAFTDPGILARFRAENRRVPVQAQRPLLQHCDRCQIWIGPQQQARHCDVCDNCVAVHDHHSTTLGICIGQRNLRFYFLFLVSGNVLVLSDAGVLVLTAYLDRMSWTTIPGVGQLLLLTVFAMPMLVMVWVIPLFVLCRKIARSTTAAMGCSDSTTTAPDSTRCCLGRFVELLCQEPPPSQVRLTNDTSR